ncbi:MAG: glutamate--tRNA ligase [Euryarchaeota archaeon]|nr:glutamate--tRNA ligase [Euryarchaeota archaeon]
MSWTPDDETLDLIRHTAVQNAIEYEGKANPGSVIGRIMGMNTDLRQYGKLISPLISKAVAEANSLAQSEGIEHLIAVLEDEAPHLLEKREKKERRTGLPELANAENGKVVLRFAPNPNGPLSFGHARGIVINGTYAKQFNGELILRFDDTDTSVKPPLIEAYKDIPNEAEWLLGFKPHRIIIASDRIENYYSYAKQMLEKGFGYVCTCSADEFRQLRIDMKECKCRVQNETINLELWNKMLDGTFKPGDAVVRVKTGMDLKNPALRDWPALRIQDTEKNPHPRKEIGSKYRVWPLLDFQSAVEDYLQGVTHIIRGKDLMDSTRKQTLLYQHFGWKYPETMYWGRVKVHEWGGFSTSQMRKDIEAGMFEGWDDPRLPTISALKKRGISAEALRRFWIELGVTQKDISVPLATLYSHNTKQIDDTAPRISFVRNPIAVELVGNHAKLISLPVHPNVESMGERKVSISSSKIYIEGSDFEKKNIRLKEFADFDLDGNRANYVSAERTDKRPIVHWISEENKIEATLIYPDGGDLNRINGLIETNAYDVGSIVQLERIGYGIIIDKSTILFTHE